MALKGKIGRALTGAASRAAKALKEKKKVADAYKPKPAATPKPKPEKTAAEALGKGKRPTPKQVEQSNLPNKPKVKAKVRSQAARKAAAERAKPGIGKKDIETGKYGPTGVKGRAKTAAKNVKTRVKRNPGKAAAASTAAVTGGALLSRDDNKVVQAKPKRLPDIKMESPKKKTSSAKNKASYSAMDERLAERRKARAAAKKKPVKNKDWVDPDTGLKASESKVDSGRGVVRDSQGRPVRSGSGEIVRTRYACGGHVKKKMATGGAVSKPKGCGCAKRGYGKAMK